MPLNIICAYRPNHCTYKDFLPAVQSVIRDSDSHPTVLMGDFNEDLLLETKSPLFTMMRANNFQQHVTKARTDQQSLLDHIYTNLPTNLVASDVADCYYSDHDLILLTVEHS